MPEATERNSEAFNAGFENICDIGKERIRRAGEKIVKSLGLAREIFDNGFRVLKVDSSNMAEVYYNPDDLKQGNIFDMADNIRQDRTTQDLLFQVLLDLGC